MADAPRARRLAVRIREIVATTLEMQVKDPRLGMVTVTDARVSPDLRDATVFYTVYGDDSARAESAAALESARGVLRAQVGRQTGVKFTPTLTFVADQIPVNAANVDALLAQARDADAELERVRSGASYAGDPDPYRQDDDDASEGDPSDAVGGDAPGRVDGGDRSGQASAS
jgi:ribosome-binding factor A